MRIPQCHIAVVEDNPGDVFLIQEHFRKVNDNCHFTVLTDGQQALDYFKKVEEGTEKNLPDILILDLNLPKHNGQEVLREIKNNTYLRSLPVIIFSSSNASDDVQQAYHRYANCYIVKPFELEKFEAAINRIHEYWFNTALLPKTHK